MPGPMLPSRLFGWADEGRRALILLDRRRIRFVLLLLLRASCMAVWPLRKGGEVWSEALLSLDDKTGSGSCRLDGVESWSMSLRRRRDGAGEAMMERLAVAPAVSADMMGEPCELDVTDDVLMAEGGTATSWGWAVRLVWTLLGRDRRESWDSEDVVGVFMGEAEEEGVVLRAMAEGEAAAPLGVGEEDIVPAPTKG